MNCVICGQLQMCVCHPGLCSIHYADVYNSGNHQYRIEQYQRWRDAGCTGTISGFVNVSSLVQAEAPPSSVSHECEDAVHQGVADSMCEEGCGQCNICSSRCPECHVCRDCTTFCDYSDSYCCACGDTHHCGNCNAAIEDSSCENDFLCGDCCDCHEDEDEDDSDNDQAYRSQAPVSNGLTADWQDIKQRYIGECKQCSNSMIACTCTDY
jgi:hypothetical protein